MPLNLLTGSEGVELFRVPAVPAVPAKAHLPMPVDGHLAAGCLWCVYYHVVCVVYRTALQN